METGTSPWWHRCAAGQWLIAATNSSSPCGSDDRPRRRHYRRSLQSALRRQRRRKAKRNVGRRQSRALACLRSLFGPTDSQPASWSRELPPAGGSPAQTLKHTQRKAEAQPTPTNSSPPPPLPLPRPSHHHRKHWTKRTKNMTIGTFNTRTLKDAFRQYELVKLADHLKIHIIAIQEHRVAIKDNSTTSIDVGEGWTLWLSTATPEGHGGIGFLYCNTLKVAMLQTRVISPRIATITFQLQHQRLHLITAHAPTSSASEANPSLLEAFADSLSVEVNALPSRDVVVIGADFNACLPRDGVVVINNCGKPNYNAGPVGDLLTSLNTVAANGHARTHHRRLPTFKGPLNRCTRLDYIAVQVSQRKNIKRVQCITPYVVNSDHRLLVMEFRIPPPYRPSNKPPRFHNWGYLRDPNKVDEFNRLLNNQPTPRTYSEFVQCSMGVADQEIPPATSKPPTKLETYCHSLAPDSDIIDSLRLVVIHEKQRAKARNNMTAAYYAARDQLLQSIIHQLGQLSEAGKQRKAWQIINGLSKRHQRHSANITATSIPQRLSLLRDHFCKLLNQPPAPVQQLAPPPEMPQIPTSLFNREKVTRLEVDAAARSMPKFKAFGADKISPALLKCERVRSNLKALMNSFMQNGEVPPEWLQSIIVAIPKKQLATTPDGLRGISLMSVATKLFNKVMLRRLIPILDDALLPWQSGFRPRRSTIEQVTALRLIVDRCKTRKKDVVVVFVDFAKAFDSVDRSALGQILRLYGVPEELSGPIMSLYKGTTATVRTPDGATDPFDTTTGILQGDTLAPFLFVIVMDYVLRTALLPLTSDAFIISPQAGVLPALAYADDVALLATTFEGAERMVTSLVSVAATVGLQLNFSKTEVLAFTSIPTPTPPLSRFQLIKECKNFTYLGVQMADSSSAFAERRRLAWVATRSLSPIFTSSAPDDIKVSLFLSVVEPILLYGCESWVTPQRFTDHINAAHRALLRSALNIHWPEVVRNEDLYERTGVSPAATTIRRKRLELFGKAVRAQHWPISKLLKYPPQEKYRRRGRPPKSMWALLQEDITHLGMTRLEDAWQEAEDARQWADKLSQCH